MYRTTRQTFLLYILDLRYVTLISCTLQCALQQLLRHATYTLQFLVQLAAFDLQTCLCSWEITVEKDSRTVPTLSGITWNKIYQIKNIYPLSIHAGLQHVHSSCPQLSLPVTLSLSLRLTHSSSISHCVLQHFCRKQQGSVSRYISLLLQPSTKPGAGGPSAFL